MGDGPNSKNWRLVHRSVDFDHPLFDVFMNRPEEELQCRTQM